MANQQHLDILKQGVEVWNKWREKHPDVRPDFSNANLHGADLSTANLSAANLTFADLSTANLVNADLHGADLRMANLSAANLSTANLSAANLSFADLSTANLVNANLRGANLCGANLHGANLSSALLYYTLFVGLDLRQVKGLATAQHFGPSEISISTVYRSQGSIPEVFLREAGVPEPFITNMRALVESMSPINFYSCFISYSSKDQAFAERLHADLQSKGVRCWFAPEDMKIGDKIRHRIDESIRLYDKLLLVLSEHSVASQWVEHEVETAIGKELEGKPNVLFPIRLDTSVLESKTGWASHIKLTRHIGDFINWKHHDDYQKAFTRLLRDLKASSEP